MDRVRCNQLSKQVVLLKRWHHIESSAYILLLTSWIFNSDNTCVCLCEKESILMNPCTAFILTTLTIPFMVPLYKHGLGGQRQRLLTSARWVTLFTWAFSASFALFGMINLKTLHTIWLLIWSFHTTFFFRMPCLWLSNLVLSKLWPSS